MTEFQDHTIAINNYKPYRGISPLLSMCCDLLAVQLAMSH
jgi:hypothetical protein